VPLEFPPEVLHSVVKMVSEFTVTGIVYFDMLEKFLMHILKQEGPDDMPFQRDRVPPRFHKEVREFLNHKFPDKWIDVGRSVTWPPNLSDLTPLDFCFLGFIKDAVYVPPLVTTLL
jgi:hypothetical protein